MKCVSEYQILRSSSHSFVSTNVGWAYLDSPTYMKIYIRNRDTHNAYRLYGIDFSHWVPNMEYKSGGYGVGDDKHKLWDMVAEMGTRVTSEETHLGGSAVFFKHAWGFNRTYRVKEFPFVIYEKSNNGIPFYKKAKVDEEWLMPVPLSGDVFFDYNFLLLREIAWRALKSDEILHISHIVGDAGKILEIPKMFDDFRRSEGLRRYQNTVNRYRLAIGWLCRELYNVKLGVSTKDQGWLQQLIFEFCEQFTEDNQHYSFYRSHNVDFWHEKFSNRKVPFERRNGDIDIICDIDLEIVDVSDKVELEVLRNKAYAELVQKYFNDVLHNKRNRNFSVQILKSLKK